MLNYFLSLCESLKRLYLYSKLPGPASLDDFQKAVNVNLVGTFNVCRLSAERMAAQEPYNESGERGARGSYLLYISYHLYKLVNK